MSRMYRKKNEENGMKRKTYNNVVKAAKMI